MSRIELIINSSDLCNQRLDKYLGANDIIKTRSRAEYLIDHKLVTVNGSLQKSSYRLKLNDVIHIEIPDRTETGLSKLDLKLDIQFEDDHLIVVNKPSGLVVHPAAGHQEDTLVNALKFHTNNLSMKFGEDRPGIVHRIDKETSGLLVIAKNDFAHEHLAKQFKEHSIKRQYEAVVLGVPYKSKGTIESKLARHPTNRKRYASVDLNSNAGKWAKTHYMVLKKTQFTSLLQLELETGRTHQIRVHMSEQGNPLLGDLVYGERANKKSKVFTDDIKKLNRFFLHAKVLEFTHPKTNKRLIFSIEWPKNEKSHLIDWFGGP